MSDDRSDFTSLMSIETSHTDPRVTALLDQIRRGDRAAFTRLVRELEPFVRASSFKICRDPDLADENAQDTMVNMYRKLHQFDGASKFCTWLYSIAVNNCRMKRRRRKLERSTVPIEAAGEKDQEGSQAEPAAADESPVERLLSAELREILAAAIDVLPEEYRAVFLLRDLEHLSTRETAEALGLSEAAVKSRLHRARRQVRARVESYLPELS
jgi:RNA polymerase sigma-70 factor (ECF subfamily)